jgi:lysozyme family protein
MTQTVVNVPESGGGGQMGEGTFYQEASVSGALTIDFANGYYQELTLTGNVTSLAFTNGPASGEGKSVVVAVKARALWWTLCRAALARTP